MNSYAGEWMTDEQKDARIAELERERDDLTRRLGDHSCAHSIERDYLRAQIDAVRDAWGHPLISRDQFAAEMDRILADDWRPE